MVNLKLLNEMICASGYPKKVIAQRAGMSVQSLHNKRTGKREFSVKEILALSEILNLSKRQREEIFLL